MRWNSLLESDRLLILEGAALGSLSVRRMKDILMHSGVAGTNITRKSVSDGEGKSQLLFVPSIKCLHAHYADYRSTSLSSPTTVNCGRTVLNPVGLLVHEILLEKFPSLIL